MKWLILEDRAEPWSSLLVHFTLTILLNDNGLDIAVSPIYKNQSICNIHRIETFTPGNSSGRIYSSPLIPRIKNPHLVKLSITPAPPLRGLVWGLLVTELNILSHFMLGAFHPNILPRRMLHQGLELSNFHQIMELARGGVELVRRGGMRHQQDVRILVAGGQVMTISRVALHLGQIKLMDLVQLHALALPDHLVFP